MSKKITSWITQARANGMTDEQIGVTLRQQGWQDSDIQHILVTHGGKRKNKWGITRVFLVIIVCLVVIPIALAIVRMSSVFITMNPDSAIAAWLSDYAMDVSVYTNAKLTAATNDGDIVFGRAFSQRRDAAGLRAFPDGGFAYRLIDKFDLFLIRPDGTIAWERNFVARFAPNYNYQTKYTIADQSEVLLATETPIGLYDYLDRDRWDVRWCSATSIQIGLTDGMSGTATTAPKLISPWARVNLEDGSVTTITDPQQLCGASTPPDTSILEPYLCESTVDFLYRAGKLLDEYDLTGAGRRQKHEILKVYWQFPCWGIYKNGELDTFNLSVQPTESDDTALVF